MSVRPIGEIIDRIWDGVKRSGIQIVCTKDQAEKMEQWRKEEEHL